jgi:maleamate amidohydrolase
MTEPKNDDARLFESRGFGRRIGFGERSALLVVDLIVGFTDASMPLGSELSNEVDATNKLLEAFHGADLPVVFTTTAYDDPGLADAGVWALKMSGLTSLMSDGPGVKLDSRLRRGPKDQLLVKKYASAFFGTDLVSRLASRRIDTVVITGCTTSGCVRATAVDSVQYGFRTMVVREAVGDRSSAAHGQALFDLNAKYCDVIDLASACRHVERPAADGRDAPRRA